MEGKQNPVYLVTGGSGYIGSHLIHELESKNIEAISFDSNINLRKFSGFKSIRHVRGDINDTKFLRDTIMAYRVEGVFHLAALKSVTESLRNPIKYDLVNVGGTASVLEACKDGGVKNLVFSSSAAVYAPNLGTNPINEDHELASINPYGDSKISGEKMIKDFWLEGNGSSICLRLFNVGGSKNSILYDSKGENVMPKLARSFLNGTRFDVYGSDLATPDGTCVRDYVHIDDVTSAFLKSMSLLEVNFGTMHGVFNVCSEIGVSVNQIITEMRDYSGLDIEVNYSEHREGDQVVVIGGNQKITSAMNWIPSKNISQIIQETWDHSQL